MTVKQYTRGPAQEASPRAEAGRMRTCPFALLTLCLFGAFALASCGIFGREERVFDAFYSAEEIVCDRFGTDCYETCSNSDLPFYEGDDIGHVVVYVNGEDGSKPFDRLWIVVSPETEDEAVAVLDDFEAYLGDGAMWRKGDVALAGKETPADLGACLISAVPHRPWQRQLPGSEITSRFTEDSGPFTDKTEVYWYARRHKTMLLIMDKVRYEYEIGVGTYGIGSEEWAPQKEAFDNFFESVVDTDGFWATNGKID